MKAAVIILGLHIWNLMILIDNNNQRIYSFKSLLSFRHVKSDHNKRFNLDNENAKTWKNHFNHLFLPTACDAESLQEGPLLQPVVCLLL